MTVYNNDRTLESFKDKLDLIRMHGLNPIAVAQMKLSDVFIFETKESEFSKIYPKLLFLPTEYLAQHKKHLLPKDIGTSKVFPKRPVSFV
jgi:hypothetical protein